MSGVSEAGVNDHPWSVATAHSQPNTFIKLFFLSVSSFAVGYPDFLPNYKVATLLTRSFTPLITRYSIYSLTHIRYLKKASQIGEDIEKSDVLLQVLNYINMLHYCNISDAICMFL